VRGRMRDDPAEARRIDQILADVDAARDGEGE
jgi:hypothetical protein